MGEMPLSPSPSEMPDPPVKRQGTYGEDTFLEYDPRM